MYKVFIAEDDDGIANAVIKRLREWDFDVKRAESYQNVLGEFLEFSPHVVLLDISLPFYNGFHWCSEIRKSSTCPVMFISSSSDNLNIITAMNMGGDDFIPKPIDLSVMMAKLQAVLRRTYDLAGKIPVLEHKGAVLNLNDASLNYNGQRIELTKNEFRILQTLMENRGKAVSRDTLMIKLWQMDSYVEENTLTVNVTRLRKKLESAGLKGFIATKVGLGYIIE